MQLARYPQLHGLVYSRGLSPAAPSPVPVTCKQNTDTLLLANTHRLHSYCDIGVYYPTMAALLDAVLPCTRMPCI